MEMIILQIIQVKYSQSFIYYLVYLLYSEWRSNLLEIMVGALFYSANENWSFLEGVYWSVCTVSGVGYGDNNIQYQSTYIFGIFYILMSCFGVIFYHINEGWDVLDCIYYICVTISTIGYGYFHPTKRSSKIFTIFYILIGVSNESWSFLEAVYWSVATITTVGYGDLAIKYESTRLFAIFYIIITTTIFAVAVNNILDVYYYTWTGHDTFTTNESENRIIAFKNAPNFVDDSIITKDKLILEILKQVNVESNEIISKITNTIELDGQLSYTKE
eukprot:gene18156-23811_t